jgi:hypothetical protein
MNTLTPELCSFLDTQIIGVLATISAPGRIHRPEPRLAESVATLRDFGAL